MSRLDGSGGLWRGLAARVLSGAALLVLVAAVLFATVEILPGDPVSRALGTSATPERVAALSSELGLDRPPVLRFGEWLAGAAQGDLGRSAVTRAPIGPIVADRAANTLLLAGIAATVIALLAVSAGLLAGSRPGGRRDTAVSTASLTVLSVPEFVLAGLLITVFAFGLGLLPAVTLVTAGGSPLDRPDALVLPVASLVLVAGAYATRLVRAAVVEAARAPHVEAARLAGVPELRVLTRHLLPGCIGPIAQVLALLVPYLVGGTVVVEKIFNYPGLGALLADAVAGRDALLVEGAGLVLAAATIATLVLADAVGLLGNPKLRTAPR